MKLENILMQSPEREDEFRIPKICDFGLCHVMDPCMGGKARMVVRCGTKGYMAPEI